MESQPQNPEFRNNPENFHHVLHQNVNTTICNFPIFGSDFHEIVTKM